jgi:hypothetical protein
MSAASTESLIAEYRQYAARHGSAKTSRIANAAAEKLAAIYRELRERGERPSLMPLLGDTDLSVRSWAAAHALEFSPDEGVAVLEALAAAAPGPLRANASMTLREWRAGRLTFP